MRTRSFATDEVSRTQRLCTDVCRVIAYSVVVQAHDLASMPLVEPYLGRTGTIVTIPASPHACLELHQTLDPLYLMCIWGRRQRSVAVRGILRAILANTLSLPAHARLPLAFQGVNQ
nr:hypothetical protein CFP56_22153 [Quercus suber]